MVLKNVSFERWLVSHGHKDARERWLRELYPWPVLAQVDCGQHYLGRPQAITYDGVDYIVTLQSAQLQPRGTYRYRLLVESDGLAWHARSFSDVYDVCAAPDGTFVTLFHKSREEPLERIARAFFGRRWSDIDNTLFSSLAVSRFLSAGIVSQVAEEAFSGVPLTHYPEARITRGAAPMFCAGSDLWLGYRFYSEHAYAWARANAGRATKVVALYFADTRYQFKTDLPPGAEVVSIAVLDAERLGGRYQDLILAVLRNLECPSPPIAADKLNQIVLGQLPAPATAITDADVQEALASLKRPCASKDELRYQLAAAVLVNAWIENERRLGFVDRKKFYAFKQRIGVLAHWAANAHLPGVALWSERSGMAKDDLLFIRIDGVDFSFHAVPQAQEIARSEVEQLMWTGVRLKPIAPLLLTWARLQRRSGPEHCDAPTD